MGGGGGGKGERSRGPPPARLGSRSSRRGFPGPRSLSLAGASQVPCCQGRSCQVRPHRAPSTSCSQNSRPLGAQSLPLLTGVGQDLLVPGCATTAPRLPPVLSDSSLPTPGPVCCPQPSQAQGLRAAEYWKSLSGTHFSLLPQVALDAPGWGRL